MKLQSIHYIVIFLIFSLKIFSTHITGGEITYEKLTGNNYKINMIIYRDCVNGVPPFDNPAFVSVFNSSGTVVSTLQMILRKDSVIPFINYTPSCVEPPTFVCSEVAIYIDTISLPPIIGGYTIVYQRCCRAATILNIMNPSITGVTFWTHIPGLDVALNNNSPHFNQINSLFFCNNESNSIDNSATDSDGDSLVYFLSNPFEGLDGCCPLILSTPQVPSAIPSCPIPPAICPSVNIAPPYMSISYSSGFSASYPIASSPAISINTNTGLISLTPNILGDFAIGIGVREYRNHILIGTYYREFTVKVVPCTPCTNINEYSNIEFNLFPNPLTNSLIIKTQNNNYDGYYTLTDLTGKVILKEVMPKNMQSIDVKNISKGVYFIKIYFNNNLESVVKKVIIE